MKIIFAAALLLLSNVANGAAPFDPSPLSGTTNLPAAAQAAPYYVCASQNFYVDTVNGSDGNAGTSAGAAFKTIGKATFQNSSLNPGGCIHVAPGTYAEDLWLSNAANSGGTPTAPIAVISTTPLGAKITGNSASNASVVTMPASYFAIDGFDVSGALANKLANGAHCIDGGYNWTSNHAHHLYMLNNSVHDCGGQGVGAAGGDYYVIEGNRVTRTAQTSGFQTSGISLASAQNVGVSDSPYYHNIIRNNVSYGNVETFACSMIGQANGCHTDGEGIIVDCFDCDPIHPYPFKTLVVGNTTYGNGGNGIQVGRSSNVVVANNLACNNYLDTNNQAPFRPELGNYSGSNNTFVNNIAYSARGAGLLAQNVPLGDAGAISVSGVNYPATGTSWENNFAWDASGAGTWTATFAPASIAAPHNQLGANPYLGTASVCPGSQNPPAASPPVVVQVSVPSQTVSVPVAAYAVPAPPLIVQIANATPNAVSLPVPFVAVPAQTVPFVVPAYTVPYQVSPGTSGVSPTVGTGEPEGFLGANPNIGAN